MPCSKLEKGPQVPCAWQLSVEGSQRNCLLLMPELPESNLRDAAVMSKSKDPAPGTQAPAQANGSSEELKKGSI